ncbi:IS1380 family transposase [Acidipropionibacterium jensenii]|uniref:IS1380 family transposase n=1 Tax=Acidipropionibacterium jensenii TaxID=1749 RepID=UPI000BC308E8|nr:IS1380 family transposase [Acidipropionibacterium jensenii]AZZ41150.1 IS1380 family transposase [Acidipropionibacterium jensenii]
MVKSTGSYPRVHVDTAPVAAVGQAGGILLVETIRAAGLDRDLSAALARWVKPWATHDPGKMLCDLALSLATGGDCLSDLAQIRAEPGIYGPVASDPTVSRLMSLLGADADRAEKAIAKARKTARARVWALAGAHAPDAHLSAADPLIIDVDATLVTAHSEKEEAAPTFKKGFGHHPLCAFIDHGRTGSGEAAVIMLRPGNAGSNTAADHKTVIRQALDQAGVGSRPGRTVLVRIDGAGSTHQTLAELMRRRVSYSVGFTLPTDTPDLYAQIPESVWTPAYNSDGDVREGADVAEFTGLLDLTGWPEGMRIIVRRERPHPGAQLRFDDVEGYRLTAFATNTRTGQLADLEVRHRRRARCEDRIRNAKDTGLVNLPLHGFGQNRIWCQIVAIAADLMAWMGLLAHPRSDTRRWEPKKLRHRLLSIPATLARTGRRTVLHVSDRHRWADTVVAAVGTLRGLPAPAR